MAQATDSQIAMWRGAIALLWVNQNIDEAEKKRLLKYFQDNICLTEPQRALLIKDMDHKIELQDVWAAITDPQDRAHLIDIAPSLFSQHGTPTPEERTLYNKMFTDQLATIDEKKFQAEIAEIKARVPGDVAEEDAEYENDFNNLGAVGRLMYHLDKMFG